MSEQNYHYIAISAFEFMSAATFDEAITRLRLRTGEKSLREQIMFNGGLLFSVYRVDLPRGEVYPVEDLRPAGQAADKYAFEGRYKFITIRGRYDTVQPRPE